MAVDATGVGRAVLETFRGADLPAELRPVVITAGHAETRDDDGCYHVPKVNLIGTIEILFQARRLGISGNMPFAETLAKELANFRRRITPAGNEVFGAWREGQHDDLVLAVAMATWLAERTPPGGGKGLPMVIGRRGTMPTGQFEQPIQWPGGRR
jgi:hypothetical protein